jgi:alkylation response protein AidB-like acyl-CoA dehydrogenase
VQLHSFKLGYTEIKEAVMDFAIPYTEEQEKFRKEVRSWLEENIPTDKKLPVDPEDVSDEWRNWWKDKHQELAHIGWLYPTHSAEFGGGGLSGDHETIIEEEFSRFGAPRGFSNNYVFGSLIVWGTEEQKQKFLKPLLTGEKLNWQRLTEPHSGADLANTKTRAVRDGDDWIVTGENVFISCYGDEDWYPGLALTDPDAPRHRNLGFFMIPNNVPGITIKTMELLPGSKQKNIIMDNVRVPGDHMIGGETQGWQVMSTLLEAEHGGRGRAAPADQPVDKLLEFTKEAVRFDGNLGSDPIVAQATSESYIESHIHSLFLQRTFWMYQNHMEMQGESNLANVYGRESTLRVAKRIRDIYAMHAFLDTKEPGSPHSGTQEINQRQRAGQNHAGGSTNIAKVILARRIGISRTQERAAPTASTASTTGS